MSWVVTLWIGLAALACGQDDAERSDPGAQHDGGGGGAASDDSGPHAALDELRAICSGCAQEPREVGDNAAHFHHAHINTVDVSQSQEYYRSVFGAERVRLNGVADALKANGAFILLEEVSERPTDELATGLEHVGWGAVDVNAWWAEVSPLEPRLDQRLVAFDAPRELVAGFWVLYLQGPSNERVEVNTEAYDEFSHVHFMTDDVDATVAWYGELLGVEPNMPAATEAALGEWDGIPLEWTSNTIRIDKVNMIFFGPPCVCIPRAFEPSDDSPIGHVAFAFADLDAVLERADAMDVQRVTEPALDEQHGFRSVFLRAPNQVLIELVEASQVPNP